jgi:hypothetical protein
MIAFVCFVGLLVLIIDPLIHSEQQRSERQAQGGTRNLGERLC